MGHGQDGPSLRGQSRGKNEGPMTGVPSPHGNLLAPFSGSRCPERKSRVLTGFKDPVGVGSHFSISPTPNSPVLHHTLSFSYAHTPCLQAFAYAVPSAWASHTHIYKANS